MIHTRFSQLLKGIALGLALCALGSASVDAAPRKKEAKKETHNATKKVAKHKGKLGKVVAHTSNKKEVKAKGKKAKRNTLRRRIGKKRLKKQGLHKKNTNKRTSKNGLAAGK